MRRSSSQTVIRLAGSSPVVGCAGVALDLLVGGVLELDEGQQVLGPRRVVGRAEPEQAPMEDQQLATRLAGIEARLLQRDSDPVPCGVRVADDVDARDLRATGGDR
jgi:hypothetical protein